MKVNNKWTVDEQAYIFHIQNKNLIRDAIATENCHKLKILKDLVINDAWYTNENNEGDPSNMDAYRTLWKEYWDWAVKEGIPPFESLFLEKAGKKVLSLIRQDSAFSERIGGVLFFFIYNMYGWKGKSKKERLQMLRNARDWWNAEDRRDRTRPWIMAIWNCVIRGYEKREFWRKSVDFVIDWVINNREKFVFDPMYDPQNWFGRKKGILNLKVHAGDA